MKVYAIPSEVPAPKVDYMNFDLEKMIAAETAHQAALKDYLHSCGFTGKNTGRIYREGVADGYAQYMMAEGKTSFLFHLPYGDAYQSRTVQHMTKSGVLKLIDHDERFQAMFSKKR